MTEKKYRESYAGALAAFLEGRDNGTLASDIVSFDTLTVAPQQKSAAIWDYIQPKMGAGGHILGVANNVKESNLTFYEVLREGAGVLDGLQAGNEYRARSPNHSIAVLLALAFTVKNSLVDNTVMSGAGVDTAQVDINERSRLANDIIEVYRNKWFSHETPSVATGGQKSVEDAYIQKLSSRYPKHMFALAHKILVDTDFEGGASVPMGFKWMKKDSCALSNKGCRAVRRLVTTLWKRYEHKAAKMALVASFSTPISTCDQPLYAFLTSCWQMRPSSISSNLKKQMPSLVLNFLRVCGIKETLKNDSNNLATLKFKICRHMRLFNSWDALRLGGGGKDKKRGPIGWSDALSGFAKAINPSIRQYNELLLKRYGKSDKMWLAEASSFVPYDLASEMYTGDSPYFFSGGGQYYEYSEAWKHDAYRALLHQRLSFKEWFALGGVELNESRLREDFAQMLTVRYRNPESELQLHVSYLQKYYFDGGFKIINEEVLGL